MPVAVEGAILARDADQESVSSADDAGLPVSHKLVLVSAVRGSILPREPFHGVNLEDMGLF